MKNYSHIEFNCIEKDCGKVISFETHGIGGTLSLKCQDCGMEYNLNGSFVSQLRKFDNLISAIREAKDILGDTNVAVNFENKEIRIPYRLLLTRMNTLLKMNIGDHKVEFRFRVEPLS